MSTVTVLRRICLLCVVLNAYCGSSVAQDSHRLNIRGIKIGTPLSAIRKRFPQLRCGRSDILVHADLVCHFPDELNIPDELGIYGGNKTIVPTLQFVGQRLVDFSFFLPQQPNTCNVIASDLGEKFGAPTAVTNKPALNDQQQWEWDSGTDFLVVTSQAKVCMVSLTSDEYRDYLKRMGREAKDQKVQKRKGTL